MSREFLVTIGIEVHVQLNTATKLWCGCSVSTEDSENQNICEVCTGQPGALPVLNSRVVEKAVATALAMNAQINEKSFFDRKNYFYPDLPKGYQITQFARPIAEGGYLHLPHSKKNITLERVQIEEDTGKSTHEEGSSYINLNRCGTPLLEIVSAPEIKSCDEAVEYLKTLHQVLVSLGVTAGKMQAGNFRSDINISLSDKEDQLGTRVEVKNLNSFKHAAKAIEYEIKRQKEVLQGGEKVSQQTRTFDLTNMQTQVLRDKGDAHDYRYFNEGDLNALTIAPELISQVKSQLPELPWEKRERLGQAYSLGEEDLLFLVAMPELCLYFEEGAALYSGKIEKLFNWLKVEVLRLANQAGSSLKSIITVQELVFLLEKTDEGAISQKQAKQVLEYVFDEKIAVKKAINDLGLEQNSDEDYLLKIVQEVVAQNPQEVAKYKAGKDRVFAFFVGQVMKMSQGKANPKITAELLKKILS